MEEKITKNRNKAHFSNLRQLITEEATQNIRLLVELQVFILLILIFYLARHCTLTDHLGLLAINLDSKNKASRISILFVFFISH